MLAMQHGDHQHNYWEALLFWALRRMARAIDPLLPWLTQEMAPTTPPLRGCPCGGLRPEQVGRLARRFLTNAIPAVLAPVLVMTSLIFALALARVQAQAAPVRSRQCFA